MTSKSHLQATVKILVKPSRLCENIIISRYLKIDPYLKNFLTYHPTLNSAIDRSRRALQLCRGDHSEWVRSHLHFWSILESKLKSENFLKSFHFLNLNIF